ncbi:hypothetical protein TrRE_jg2551 [Triparma retinervis]|uniref:HMG box domain-containing protein n=1 Tax=Triparma retinervis TaxID=2557542 RepID=A0A9W6ZLS0_9STRA|nr:hypothetical protein TrRE_jg2551 [Triparma retinervis]
MHLFPAKSAKISYAFQHINFTSLTKRMTQAKNSPKKTAAKKPAAPKAAKKTAAKKSPAKKTAKKTAKKSAKKDGEEKKKRPASAYNMFCKEWNPKLKDKTPDFAERSRAIGKKWGALTDAQKASYKPAAN